MSYTYYITLEDSPFTLKRLRAYRFDGEELLVKLICQYEYPWTKCGYSNIEGVLNTLSFFKETLLFEGNEKEYNKYLMGLEMLK